MLRATVALPHYHCLFEQYVFNSLCFIYERVINYKAEEHFGVSLQGRYLRILTPGLIVVSGIVYKRVRYLSSV